MPPAPPTSGPQAGDVPEVLETEPIPVPDGAARIAQRRRHRADPRRLPDPGTHRPGRKAVGVPGFRGDLAAAGAGHRCRAGVRHRAQRRGAPRCASAGRGGHRLLRVGPRADRRLHRRARPATRSSSPRTPPRRSTWSPTRWATPPSPTIPPRTVPARSRRRGRRHRDGAPRESDSVAGTLPADRRHAALVQGHRRLPARPDRHRRADQPADQGGRVHPPVQRARHDQPGRRAGRRGAAGRRADRARRLPVGAAHAGRRHRAGRRFRRVLRAQDAGPERGRRAVRPVRAAGRDAAVPDRRIDDRAGLHRPRHLCARRRPGSRPGCR